MKQFIYIINRVFLVFLLMTFSFSAMVAQENDFEVKGLHLDFRTQVMTMPALYELADHLAEKGLNTILFEYEASFPFETHATICNEYAFTQQEVKDFVAYCSGLGITIIPLQNCFGHCEYILRHDRYAHLREDKKEVSQVCPLKTKEAKEVFREIFREVAALHPSPYFHIGADETYLLGDCKHCAAVVEKEGKSRLFVDYINAMCELVLEMGKRPIIWSDIILKYPDAVHELPKDLIFLDWNYGWEPNRFGKLDILFSTGAEVWGAPSLRSHPDHFHLIQWEKHFQNLTTFIPFTQSKGYQGIIETSWSTSGLYGYLFDTNWEVVTMHPIRSVYPLSGFNILIDAFSHSVHTKTPLDYASFIKEYGQKKYGLSIPESDLFLTYFTHPQEEILRGGKDKNGVAVSQILADCMQLREKFKTLKPKQNKEEFAHYTLMLDIRINYLSFKEIEAIYESPAYNRSRAPELLTRLEPVLRESTRLDEEFVRLNSSYLKEGELDYIRYIRNEKMNSIYKRLQSQ